MITSRVIAIGLPTAWYRVESTTPTSQKIGFCPAPGFKGLTPAPVVGFTVIVPEATNDPEQFPPGPTDCKK